MDKATLYAVVLTFPDEINGELDILRKNYKQYVNYTIVPHVTLKMPFTLVADITVVIDRLKAIAEKTRSFTLVIAGIQFFDEPGKVAYVAIENKKPVLELHTDIVNSLQGLVKGGGMEIHELDRFVPHITIGASIPDDVFPAVKRLLSDHHLHLECEISAFSLYSGTLDGEWQPECVLDFLKE